MRTFLYPSLCLSLMLAFVPACTEKTPLYKDSQATPEARTEDLLSRMTLAEKISQLECRWLTLGPIYTDGIPDYAKMAELFPDGIGQLGRVAENKVAGFSASTLPPREAAEAYNRLQRYFVEHTRLGIPVLVHEECLHGHQSLWSTNLPIPIGMSCSWDDELYYDAYTMVAREVRALGGVEVLAPIVDITRDPRWGRTEETMGEDPYLVGRLGSIQVKAMQGDTSDGRLAPDKVATTLKHFGVHGASYGGRNRAPSYADELSSLEYYLRPFQMCIEDAHPWNIMISYPELWGVPAHGNRHLNVDILRGKYGFDGLIVSDYSGIQQLQSFDGVAESPLEAARMAFTAGVDIELPDPACYPYLQELVENGELDERLVDDAVRRILLEKFRAGLFENPYVDPDAADRLVGNDEGRALAYRAAAESIVLLQNRDDVLPFDISRIRRLAVIGPQADEVHLGGYVEAPRQAPSVLEVLREKYGDKIEILHAKGCRITHQVMPAATQQSPSALNRAGIFNRPVTVVAQEDEDRRMIEQAVALASQADAIILCLGSNEDVAKENGDTPSLELMGLQNELAKRIGALGKPTCALIITGTPNNIATVADNVPGVLQCYYPGQEGSYAMVDAIFGNINPSGKLTLSIPRSAGHVPAYYNHKRSSNTRFTVGQQSTPLYPFGFGLSYTEFSYSEPRLSADSMSADDTVYASVDVTNVGAIAGDEIVQLYIKDDVSSVSRPVKELKGYQRIHLESGQSQTVTFPIDRKSLEYYGLDLELHVEPGTFTVMIGPSSLVEKGVKLSVGP